jgi:multidrug efflux pump subunit AcrA (membrane-fusion protein)
VSDVPYRTVGRISFVSPVADPASGLVEVRVSFPNSQLLVKPGIRGSIELP